MRTSKTDWFLDIAERCAHQGTCLRRKYGAVIVDQSGTVVSTGYVGAPAGQKDCLEIGHCWREDHNIPAGTCYEKCLSVHAEMNAIIQAGKSARGATLYLCGIDAKTDKVITAKPCFLCAKMIVNAGIEKVIVRRDPKDMRDDRSNHPYALPYDTYFSGMLYDRQRKVALEENK